MSNKRLRKRGNHYYFRVILPTTSANTKHREICLSLGTNNYYEANYLAMQSNQYWEKLKAMVKMKITSKNLNSIVDAIRKLLKANLEKVKLSRYPNDSRVEFIYDTYSDEQKLDNYTYKIVDDYLNNQNISFSYKQSITANPLNLSDSNSRKLVDELAMEQEVLSQVREVIKEESENLLSQLPKYKHITPNNGIRAVKTFKATNLALPPLTTPQESEEDNSKSSPHPTPQEMSRPSSMLFSELVELFLTERKSEATENYKKTAKSRFNLAIEYMGDKPIDKLHRNDFASLVANLAKLPTHRQAKIYNGKTLQQIMAMSTPQNKCLSPNTIGNYYDLYKELAKFAEDTDLIPKSFMAGIKHKRQPQTRVLLTTTELTNIFNFSKNFKSQKNNKWKWWQPVLALFTGVRTAENGQLLASQVKQDSQGVWYIEVANGTAGQRVKTPSGVRNIPVHSALIDLGFIEYVTNRNKNNKNNTKLLFNLPVDKTKRHNKMQHAFNVTWRKNGLIGKDKDFYCFRHNFVSAFIGQGVDSVLRDTLSGHSPTGSTAVRNYSHPNLQQLKTAIEKIQYDPVIYKALGIKPRP